MTQPESRYLKRPVPRRSRWGRVATFTTIPLAALGVIGFYRPPSALSTTPLGAVAAATNAPLVVAADTDEALAAEPSTDAFGRSGALQVRFALPGGAVQYPLVVKGNPASLTYQWLRLADSAATDPERALGSDTLRAPRIPGFYRLALARDGVRRIVDGVTLAVMVPFEEKKGGWLDGYRIGTYLAERLHSRQSERPAGFVQVTAATAELPISKHLRLADFLNQDDQETWPRYAAVNPRVLDKLELVLEQLQRWRGGERSQLQMVFDLHSTFRSPAHNRNVRRAAHDSRHQYGDAVDVAIDADGDGRMTVRDAKLVAQAVEIVEFRYPDLIGGMGLYTSRRYRHPYVHIDARGTRARWKS
ncbi:MAG: D-Ala-D-Ala carboxypeptidase family metallohydrolase [Gemmatimonadota bacterium]|nr:D-Ala-D-Ala carboxypeptidase family metallohydrolase [Gemmatimonadota bacterium]